MEQAQIHKPRYGFNFLWMYSWQPGRNPETADEQALDFMAETGFDFVRIPTDYNFWTKDFDYLHPDESVFGCFDHYLAACRARGLHMSLNLHRAPGYCINRNDLERDNLWLDEVAKEGFVFLWETFAQRYKGVPNEFLSFDLLNEPPNEGQYGMTRDGHAALMRRTVAAIRTIDPTREIVIDGLGGGHFAMPELSDLGVIHSGRGYMPMSVSHYQAGWWAGSEGLPPPIYPGEWNGYYWDRDFLHDFYAPWREVETGGTRVHIGECGCYNKTPNDIALRWFRDLFGLFKHYGWGFALWNFKGDFGIIEHGRPGTVYETINGYQVDRELMDIILESRVRDKM